MAKYTVVSRDNFDSAVNAIKANADQLAINISQVDGNKLDNYSIPSEGKMEFTDSANGVLTKVNLSGHSYQKQYEGYNLCKGNWSIKSGASTNGLSFTKNADNTVTFTGTPTATESSNLITVYAQANTDWTAGHVYKAVCFINGQYKEDNGYCKLEIMRSGATQPSYVESVEYSSAILYVRPYIRITSANYTAGITVGMMLVDSTAQGEKNVYEPYVGGVASPNPAYPQTIESVDEIHIWSHAKNLVDINDFEQGGIDANGNFVTNADNARSKTFIPVKPSTNLTISKSQTTSIVRINEYDANKQFIKRTQTSTNMTITLSSDTRFIKHVIYIAGSTNSMNDIAKYAWQVEEGSTATAYEPYTGYSATITPSRPLNRIGDYVDTVDVDEGVWRYRTNTVFIKDVTTFHQDSANKRFMFSPTDLLNKGTRTLPVVADNFISKMGLPFAVWDNGIYNSETAIWINDASSATEAQFKTRNGNCKVIYPVSSEYTPAINASDLAILKSIRTYDPHTIVSITDKYGNDISSLFDYPINHKAVVERFANTDSVNKRIDALYALSQGKTWTMESKTKTENPVSVPDNAQLASVCALGGRTVVWNKVVNALPNWNTESGVTSSFDDETVFSNSTAGNGITVPSVNIVGSHKYYMSVYLKRTDSTSVITFSTTGSSLVMECTFTKTNEYEKFSTFKTASISKNGSAYIYFNNNSATCSNMYVKNPILVDLTQMFGAGNEPSTVTDSRIQFIESYATAHPEYNAGELVSYGTDEVVTVGKNLVGLDMFSKGYNINATTGQVETYSNGDRWVVLEPIDVSAYNNVTISCTARKPTNAVPCIMFSTFNGDTLVERSYFGTMEKYDAVRTVDTSNATKMYIGLANLAADAILTKSNVLTWFKGLMVFNGSSAISYIPYNGQTISLPNAITSLDGYGIGINDTVRNYVEWADDGRVYYHKMVGSVDAVCTITSEYAQETGSYVCTLNEIKDMKISNYGNGCCAFANVVSSGKAVNSIRFGANNNNVYIYLSSDFAGKDVNAVNAWLNTQNDKRLYYELATPIVTDITDLMVWDGTLSAETGGTITFKADDLPLLPVPTTIEYCKKITTEVVS